MKEEEKYYVPDLSEFHVGFEFEIKDIPPPENDWHKDVLSTSYELEKLEKWIQAGDIRVRKLSREDIEAEGFTTSVTMTYQKRSLLIHTTAEYGSLDYFRICHDLKTQHTQIEDVNSSTLFSGTIRNRSELRRIMKMVGLA